MAVIIESFFDNVLAWMPVNVIKKEPHSFFVNFTKFLKTHILKNTSWKLLLCWSKIVDIDNALKPKIWFEELWASFGNLIYHLKVKSTLVTTFTANILVDITIDVFIHNVNNIMDNSKFWNMNYILYSLSCISLYIIF